MEDEFKAENIFSLSSRFSHIKFSRAIQFGRCDSAGSNFVNWSAVCYEKYDVNLSDWMLYLRLGLVSDAPKVNVMVGECCVCPYWIDEIRQLIKGIAYLHSIGLYHGALNKGSSYILVGGSFKLINVEGLLSEHDPSRQELKKTKDFHGLWIVLERLFALLSQFGIPSSSSWEERNSFMYCFDSSSRLQHAGYVERLENHTFLRTPKGRMEYFDKLHHNKDSHL